MKKKQLKKAFEGHDIDMILKKCKQLKGTDGEGWAIGNFIIKCLTNK